jgi:hypothetical protein
VIKVHVLMGNDFPDGVYLTKRGVDAAIRRRKAKEEQSADRSYLRYAPRIYWRSYEFRLGPPVVWPRRSGGGHWEAQFGRLWLLFNHCGHPIKVRITDKDYEPRG